MLFGAFFSDLDPLLLAVCDDDLCVLLCVAVCVTDSSVCDSSLCGCFRGLSFFGFFLLLGRILFFFFEVGCREEVGGGIRRYTDTARARERERERERVREGRRRSSGERWTRWRSWGYMMWSVMSW